MAAILTDRLVSVGPCCECGVDFAMPEYIKQSFLVSHQTFHCPFGHKQHYPAGKSETDKLREQIAALQSSRDFENQQRRAAEAEVKSLQRSVKRAKKRAANGVCPCCHRTVKQMAEHMKTKHPDYVAEVTK